MQFVLDTNVQSQTQIVSLININIAFIIWMVFAGFVVTHGILFWMGGNTSRM